MSREIRGLGDEIESRRDSKAKDHEFEIRVVSNGESDWGALILRARAQRD